MFLIDVAVILFIFYLFFLALSKISDSVSGETVYYQHREEHIPDDQHFNQGYFLPNNPEKYRGDSENIIYRSIMKGQRHHNGKKVENAKYL